MIRLRLHQARLQGKCLGAAQIVALCGSTYAHTTQRKRGQANENPLQDACVNETCCGKIRA